MRLVQVTHNGHPLLVNPDHIVMVERNGDGTATLYLSNREYKKVAQTVEEVQELSNSIQTQTLDIVEDIDPETPADETPADDKKPHPASTRQTKPVTPPETR